MLRFLGIDTIAGMRAFLVLFVHLIVTVVQLTRPGGLRSVVAESVLLKHQLLIFIRGRKRVPNLRAADRFVAGLCTRKYRMLFAQQVESDADRGFDTFRSWENYDTVLIRSVDSLKRKPRRINRGRSSDG